MKLSNQMMKNKWWWLLVAFALVIIVIIIMKKLRTPLPYEGFEQGEHFVLKRNNDIYDSYYAMIYDELYRPAPRVEFEYKTILDMTHPTTKNSVFLDVGSGTGSLVNKLTAEGYVAYGIDTSRPMVELSQQKYPSIDTKCGDVMDPMSYDRGMFTHVTCMNFTVYHLQDKWAFFRNCYYWLVPNGYLILHLVDRAGYNPIVPAAIPSAIDNPQKYSQTRITDAVVQFPGFSYKNTTDFDSTGDDRVVVKETFKDAATAKVRQNELTLYMQDIRDLLYIAQKCGFILQGKATYSNDDSQYIYMLERQA